MVIAGHNCGYCCCGASAVNCGYCCCGASAVVVLVLLWSLPVVVAAVVVIDGKRW